MSKNKVLERGPLERVFRGSAMAKILDFLVTFKTWDYSKSDIAKNSGVNFRTVLRELPRLEELGVVKQTRLVGRAKMYQLNQENPIAQLFDQLCMKIATADVQRQLMKKEKIELPA
jgi:Fe2+ or Zn2+ uptake regulation protein